MQALLQLVELVGVVLEAELVPQVELKAQLQLLLASIHLEMLRAIHLNL